MGVVVVGVGRTFLRERIPSTEPQKAEREDEASPQLETKRSSL